jgi:hypothetical protein
VVILGIYLTGDDVPQIDLNIGPEALVSTGAAVVLGF